MRNFLRPGRAAKRTFDVAAAALLLAVALPIIVLMALAVRLESRGNPFFVQTRVGRGGRTFRMVKMRTLYRDRFGIDMSRELSLHDPRITHVGRLLRRTKLDELPQLVHVLGGQMSLIGPRPDIPEQVAHYTPAQRRRLDVRPGLTGAAQVCGNTALSWGDRIQIDRWYIQHWTWRLDVKILALTLLAVLAGETRAANRLHLPLNIFNNPHAPAARTAPRAAELAP